MTRKDFRAMAQAVKEIKNAQERLRMARTLAEMCRASNPRFDWVRFARACNVEE